MMIAYDPCYDGTGTADVPEPYLGEADVAVAHGVTDTGPTCPHCRVTPGFGLCQDCQAWFDLVTYRPEGRRLHARCVAQVAALPVSVVRRRMPCQRA